MVAGQSSYRFQYPICRLLQGVVNFLSQFIWGYWRLSGKYMLFARNCKYFGRYNKSAKKVGIANFFWSPLNGNRLIFQERRSAYREALQIPEVR
jgi:hypothetical protein